jgi:DHA2 family multidrug resistance protein
LETLFTKREDFIINANVSLSRPATQGRPADRQYYFIRRGTADAAGAMHRAMIEIDDIVSAQAAIMGYAD